VAEVAVLLDFHSFPNSLRDALRSYSADIVWTESCPEWIALRQRVANGAITPAGAIEKMSCDGSWRRNQILKRLENDFDALYDTQMRVLGEQDWTQEWGRDIRHWLNRSDDSFSTALLRIIETGSLDAAADDLYTHALAEQRWQHLREMALWKQWTMILDECDDESVLFIIGEAHSNFAVRFTEFARRRLGRSTLSRSATGPTLLPVQLLAVDLGEKRTTAVSEWLAREWFERHFVEAFNVAEHSSDLCQIIDGLNQRVSLEEIRRFAGVLSTRLARLYRLASLLKVDESIHSGTSISALIAGLAVEWSIENNLIRRDEVRCFRRLPSALVTAHSQ